MSVSKISFTLLRCLPVPSRTCTPRDLEALAAFVLGREKVRGPAELAVSLTGHRQIQTLNRRYRGVDRTTDVISFRNAAPPALAGDIAINVRLAAHQARSLRHSLRREVRLLLIHGVLHLLGYTDYAARSRRRMFKRQNALLRFWERKHP